MKRYYLVAMVLVACATAATRRLRVMVKPGYFEPCNLWAVVALPPGNRKSAVQSAATAPLVVWERDQATIMEPELLLADEPTGNLDRASGREVIETLEGLNDGGLTLVVVTHDPELGQRAHRRIRMDDGAIVADR